MNVSLRAQTFSEILLNPFYVHKQIQILEKLKGKHPNSQLYFYYTAHYFHAPFVLYQKLFVSLNTKLQFRNATHHTVSTQGQFSNFFSKPDKN